MEDFLSGLITEQKELNIKVMMLENFLDTQDFFNLSIDNRILLKEQALAMRKYNDILRIRIELNK